jgi:sensor domain CHASE-containing protein
MFQKIKNWVYSFDSSRQTKIFWINTLLFAFLTIGTIAYAYFWFDRHRSRQEEVK